MIAATPSERNWRGILIALLVIVAVLGMIVFSIVLVSPVDDGPRIKGRRPTLQETLNLQRIASKPFNGSWISGKKHFLIHQSNILPPLQRECRNESQSINFSDTEVVYRDPNMGVSIFNAENMTCRVIITNSTFVSNF